MRFFLILSTFISSVVYADNVHSDNYIDDLSITTDNRIKTYIPNQNEDAFIATRKLSVRRSTNDSAIAG